MLIHVALLFVLGLIVIALPSHEFTPIELGWSTLVESNQETPTEIEVPKIDIPEVSMNNPQTQPRNVTPKEETEDSTEPVAEESPELKLVDVSQALSLRKEPEERTTVRKRTGS